MKYIGLDPGKFGLKAVTKCLDGNWEYFYLRSKIEKNPESAVGGGSYLIQYSNEDYLIGPAAKNYSMDADKHVLQHKLLTYIGINELAGSEPCKVVVGCPYSLFKNVKYREEYEQYMKDTQIKEIKINGLDVLINTEELMSFPECGGIAYSEPDEDFVNKVRGVIDLGGLNVTGCIFEDLVPVKDSDFTENLGSIILKSKIRGALNKEFCLNLQEYNMQDILKKGLYIKGKKVDKAVKIIDDVIMGHLDEITNEAKKHNWPIDNLDITLGGGCVLEIKNLVLKYYENSKICSDPLYGNAKGNYNIAMMFL